MMISIGWMFDSHIGGPPLLLTVLTLQVFAVFWPNIMGSLVRPILLRTTTLVPAEPKSEIVTGYHHDASWFFYEMTPELRDWYKGNCTGWMGVIPEREVVMRQGKRTFWFTNENDAFAFRMRWAGL
ncbi:MAG: hypothetical protein EOO77_46250 [Oxalobacteraceae bacterium]|nr:MAG: hypothetical protein EOO77_46250 [Oxalobacteraceae bacterium]